MFVLKKPDIARDFGDVWRAFLIGQARSQIFPASRAD
jgi:hypothetical protein